MKGNKKIISALAIALAVLLFISFIVYDYFNGKNTFEKKSFVMATVATYKLQGFNSEEVYKQISDTVNDAENKLISKYKPTSEIFALNKNGSVILDEKVVDWLKTALDVCNKSQGAFDITVGSLTDFWNIGGENPQIPNNTQLKELLSKTDYRKIKINANKASVGNMKIDLGAVGKGIACDIAKNCLDNSSQKKAIIAYGGSVLLWSKNNSKFKVGVRDPFGSVNDCFGVVYLPCGFVSTSGDYERVSVINGKKYHHIINPKTGFPTENNLKSVTVFCDSGLLSDALSTACFVLGKDDGIKLLKKYNAKGIFITNKKEVYIDGELMKDFKITDSDNKVIPYE